ncbi:MAG: energy transducer TonB, partial [Myxococcales bacterium]|nr:energy transducer TonB [Myxococcales bacterium]
VEHDHTFTSAPEVVDARRCFAVELGAGSVLPLCFEASAVEDVPGASADPGGALGLGSLGGELGSLGGELGGLGVGPGAGDPGLGSGGLGSGGLGAIGSGSGAGAGTKRKRPKASAGSGTVVGSLDKDETRRVVHRHANEVKYCYERALVKDPTLAGKVTIAFTIDPAGLVSTASIKDDTLADASVGKCIVKAVQRWTFPKPVGGGMVVAKYPFIFSSG